MSPHRPHSGHAHDLWLARDLRILADAQRARRQALRWLAGAGALLPLWGCGGGSSGSSTATTSNTGTTDTTTDAGSCSLIPSETAGPYPADGSNAGADGSLTNALALTGIVRSDIRGSIAGATGTAAGVPLAVKLRIVDTASACTGLAGYAVYLWHCDREGRYSMYSSGVTDQNYLRGVQATDADGLASFETVFPGCYSGRMPHIHFEIYRSLASAGGATNRLRTSQLALPTDVCEAVYATTGYATSLANLSRISFATDNVFSDGVTLQLADITGSVAEGLIAELDVGIVAWHA